MIFGGHRGHFLPNFGDHFLLIFGVILGSFFGHFWGHFLDHFLVTFWTTFGCHFGADGPGVIFTAGLGVIFTAGRVVTFTAGLGIVQVVWFHARVHQTTPDASKSPGTVFVTVSRRGHPLVR